VAEDAMMTFDPLAKLLQYCDDLSVVDGRPGSHGAGARRLRVRLQVAHGFGLGVSESTDIDLIAGFAKGWPAIKVAHAIGSKDAHAYERQLQRILNCSNPGVATELRKHIEAARKKWVSSHVVEEHKSVVALIREFDSRLEGLAQQTKKIRAERRRLARRVATSGKPRSVR
jgi:hypothetical protein